MSSTPDTPETNAVPEVKAVPEAKAVPEVKARPEKKAGGPQLVLNKYEAVRLAKKKQRRKAHRLTIKRSNTGG